MTRNRLVVRLIDIDRPGAAFKNHCCKQGPIILIKPKTIAAEEETNHLIHWPDSAEFRVNPTPNILIEAPPRWEALDLCELWRYRELLYFLALRDVTVRPLQADRDWRRVGDPTTFSHHGCFFSYLRRIA